MSRPAWTRLEDIRQRLEKRWRSGQLLRDSQQPEEAFPLRLPLKKPSSRELGEQFQLAREWAQRWQADEARGGFSLQ